MEFPTIPELPTTRQTVDVFRGYRREARIGAGEFYEMENLTSDHYPALAPRGGRGQLEGVQSPSGLIAKDALCYIDGADFVMNGYHVDLHLTDAPKQLISMGACVIILPDRKWINTLDLTDFGSIDAVFQSDASVALTLCSLEGVPYEGFSLSDSPPETGELWMDTSARPHVLKRYSAQAETWTAVPATYVKISAPGIGVAFSQYDGVTISGLSQQELNGAHVLWDRGEDFLLVPGVLDGPVTESTIEVRRQMPQVDFLLEAGNRLWGCRYGLDAHGRVVNEIYASKLGDFKNWNCYMGTSTDSYAAACGTDGPFTGAVSYLGNPLFFKEGCLHRVYGSYPANFQIQTTTLRGVERGSERSLAQLGEVLYYKSPAGICAYDGSLPRLISQDLGNCACREAVAGATGDKLYVSMKDGQENSHLFVFDPGRGLWHREDAFRAEQFCFCRGQLYAISDGKIVTLLGGSPEGIPWMAVTGELGLTDPDRRALSRVTLRLSLEPGSELRLFLRYDDSPGWQSVGFLKGTGQKSISLPIPVRRCRHLRLKLEGKGDIRLHSLTQTLIQGGACL